MINKDAKPEQYSPCAISLQALSQKDEGDARDNTAQSPEKTQKILHELYVHQLELEMQNEELRRVHAELDAERERYYNLYDLAPVGYCTISVEDSILEANLTITKMLGVARGELIKQSLSHLIYKEDKDIYSLLIKNLIKTGKPQSCELRLVKMDETTFWAQLAVIVALDTNGTARYWVALTDITNLKNAEKALKESEAELRTAKEAAEESNIAKSQFLSNISHEIWTPMTSIIGMIDLILMTELSEEHLQYLTIVKSSTEVLRRVLNDILDYSKIEAGKVNLDQFPFNIRKIIDEVVSSFQVTAKQKNINISLNSIDNLIPKSIVGDSIRLKQVLFILVDNGVKFTNHGEVTISIDLVELDNSSIKLKFIVSDSGIGIPEDKLDKLFKKFSQVDDSNTREFGGAGLGLAISKKLAELMGGDIYIESKEGIGSEFYFTAIFGVQKL